MPITNLQNNALMVVTQFVEFGINCYFSYITISI